MNLDNAEKVLRRRLMHLSDRITKTEAEGKQANWDREEASALVFVLELCSGEKKRLLMEKIRASNGNR